MPPFLSSAVDLLLLPWRLGQAVTALPRQLATTTAELQHVRMQLLATRAHTQALNGPDQALVDRSEATLARIDALLGAAPDELDAAALEELRDRLIELQHARAAMADLAG